MCRRLGEPFTAVLKSAVAPADRPQTDQVQRGLQTAAGHKETRTYHVFGKDKSCTKTPQNVSCLVLFFLKKKTRKEKKRKENDSFVQVLTRQTVFQRIIIFKYKF